MNSYFTQTTDVSNMYQNHWNMMSWVSLACLHTSVKIDIRYQISDIIPLLCRWVRILLQYIFFVSPPLCFIPVALLRTGCGCWIIFLGFGFTSLRLTMTMVGFASSVTSLYILFSVARFLRSLQLWWGVDSGCDPGPGPRKPKLTKENLRPMMNSLHSKMQYI